MYNKMVKLTVLIYNVKDVIYNVQDVIYNLKKI